MKKYLIPFLCLLLLYTAGVYVAVSADDTVVVKVGVYENEPKIFTNDEGVVSGLWADIINYMASKEGWEIEYVHGTWTQCLTRLENNQIDMMPDVAYSEERNERFNFSQEPVYVS